MWVMTSFGVLMPSVRPAGTIPAGDDRLIQVRARRKRELIILKKEYLPELGEIIEIPYSDYEYRAYCTHEQWAAAIARISMDIDYTKFKPTTESKYGDKQLHSLYNELWSVFFNTVSTKRHQERYLLGPEGTRGKHRKAGTSRWTGTVSGARIEAEQYGIQAKNWWEDAERGADAKTGKTLRDLIDSEYGITSDDIARFGGDYDDDPEIKALVNNWDDKDVPVTRRPNGTIDHSHCKHAKSKNARRRCRRQADRSN